MGRSFVCLRAQSRLWGGMLVRDVWMTATGKKDTTLARSASEFSGVVEPAGTEAARFVAEAGRHDFTCSCLGESARKCCDRFCARAEMWRNSSPPSRCKKVG